MADSKTAVRERKLADRNRTLATAVEEALPGSKEAREYGLAADLGHEYADRCETLAASIEAVAAVRTAAIVRHAEAVVAWAKAGAVGDVPRIADAYTAADHEVVEAHRKLAAEMWEFRTKWREYGVAAGRRGGVVVENNTED